MSVRVTTTPNVLTPEDLKHPNVQCDGCNTAIGNGIRFKCLDCLNYDLCGNCEFLNLHDPSHVMAHIRDTRVIGEDRLRTYVQALPEENFLIPPPQHNVPVYASGRPYTAECGEVQTAVVSRNHIESDWVLELDPVIPEDRRERERLADKWVERGLAEQASVASFAHFSLQLLAVGAPAKLLEMTQKAMLDEINHAKISFGLASAYKGEYIYPGEYKSHTLNIQPDIKKLVASTALEGCFNETYSFLVEAEEIESSEDPLLRKIHDQIIEDEGFHARLAWETIHWAINSRSTLTEQNELKEIVKQIIENELEKVEDPYYSMISTLLNSLVKDTFTDIEKLEGTLKNSCSNDHIQKLSLSILQSIC